MKKIKTLIKKICTKEVFFYCLFGVFTTAVNIGLFYVLNSIFNLEENLSNNIAIFASVLFAYFSNRKLVFNSKATTLKEKFLEFCKFMFGRLFTMILESSGFFILCNLFKIQELISKASITVIVVILNFFISKFFAFKK